MREIYSDEKLNIAINEFLESNQNIPVFRLLSLTREVCSMINELPNTRDDEKNVKEKIELLEKIKKICEKETSKWN